MVQILGADVKSPPSTVGVALLQQQFHSSPYWSLRQLICVLDQGRVTVRGTLPSYYLKQVAQSVATKALGVDRIRSDIDVQSE
jgi:hypothetical protein